MNVSKDFKKYSSAGNIRYVLHIGLEYHKIIKKKGNGQPKNGKNERIVFPLEIICLFSGF